MEYGTRNFVSRKFGNSATIEAMPMRAYKGAEKKQGYRLCCYADYDDGMLYYCSCHETYKEAYAAMMSISCGEWEEVIDRKIDKIYAKCE